MLEKYSRFSTHSIGPCPAPRISIRLSNSKILEKKDRKIALVQFTGVCIHAISNEMKKAERKAKYHAWLKSELAIGSIQLLHLGNE